MSQWGFSDNHSHCTMKIILFQMIAKKIIYTSPIFLSYIGWFFHFMQHIWHSIKNWKQFLEQEEKSTLKWLLLEQIIVHCAFSSWEISSRKFSHQLKIWRVTSKMICEKTQFTLWVNYVWKHGPVKLTKLKIVFPIIHMMQLETFMEYGGWSMYLLGSLEIY